MSVSKQHLLDYLRDNGVANKYYIEYREFFSTHLAHGAIALFRLGASEEYFKSFTSNYVERLDPKDGPIYKTHEAQNPKASLVNRQNTNDKIQLKLSTHIFLARRPATWTT